MLKKILLASAALAIGANVATAKDLKSIGISVGSMGNPFFIALAKGAEFEAKKTNPNVKVTAVGFDYDLGKLDRLLLVKEKSPVPATAGAEIAE